jgi:DNA-binding response OmpR family regulator
MAFTEVPDVIIILFLTSGCPTTTAISSCKVLSEIPGLAGVPVIVLTARDRFTHEWRCRDVGAKRFFQKPVEDRILLAAIEQLIG